MSVDLSSYKLYSNQPPGSGAVLAYMTNILKNYGLQPKDIQDPVTYQRIAETFKWGYARRSELGDPFDTKITQDINQVFFS